MGKAKRGARQSLMARLIDRAKRRPKRIVFPESDDKRVLDAVCEIAHRGIAKPILLGDERTVRARIKAKRGSKLVRIHNPSKGKDYTGLLVKLRKRKGMTPSKAKRLLKENIYYATLMVKAGDADGLVAGAEYTTAHTLRPALQIIRTKARIKTASAYFIMMHEQRVFFFADCAMNIDPDDKQLADIALSTANTAKSYGIKPRVALLSFSSKGSGRHPSLDKIRSALRIAKRRAPELVIDGELQVDAAIVPQVAKRKAPGSPIKGNANILIFPDLNTGNISYKLTQRLGGYRAIGPIIQGLNKPVNDLSRGCTTEDIVEVTAITVIQAQNQQ